MAKLFDLIGVSVLIAFLTFVWAGMLLENIVLSVVVSVAVTGVFLVVHHKTRRREEKPYAYDRLAIELSVRGPSFLIEILKSILQNKVFESGFNYICLENALILACFKFGNVTINDTPNIFSTATKYNKTRVFLFARGVERKALRLLENCGLSVSVVKIREIYRLLKKHNQLPALTKKSTFKLRDIPALLLSKGNVKGLVFSGVVLITTAFFTPLKIYYLIFGSVALLLAILSMTPLGKDAPSENRLKDIFSAEATKSDFDEILVENKLSLPIEEEKNDKNNNDDN